MFSTRSTRTALRAREIMRLPLLMVACGIRGISAVELLVDDIDWQQSRIRIGAQKGGKEKTLPLLEPVGEAISELFTRLPDELVFRRSHVVPSSFPSSFARSSGKIILASTKGGSFFISPAQNLVMDFHDTPSDGRTTGRTSKLRQQIDCSTMKWLSKLSRKSAQSGTFSEA